MKKILSQILALATIAFSGDFIIVKGDKSFRGGYQIKDTLEATEARTRSSNLRKYIETTLNAVPVVVDKDLSSITPTNPMAIWYLSKNKKSIIEFRPRTEDSTCISNDTKNMNCLVVQKYAYYAQFDNVKFDCIERSMSVQNSTACVNDFGGNIDCSIDGLYQLHGQFRDVNPKENELVHSIIQAGCDGKK